MPDQLATFVDPSPTSLFYRQAAAFRDGEIDGRNGLPYMPWPWTEADETPAYDYGFKLGSVERNVA